MTLDEQVPITAASWDRLEAAIQELRAAGEAHALHMEVHGRLYEEKYGSRSDRTPWTLERYLGMSEGTL